MKKARRFGKFVAFVQKTIERCGSFARRIRTRIARRSKESSNVARFSQRKWNNEKWNRKSSKNHRTNGTTRTTSRSISRFKRADRTSTKFEKSMKEKENIRKNFFSFCSDTKFNRWHAESNSDERNSNRLTSETKSIAQIVFGKVDARSTNFDSEQHHRRTLRRTEKSKSTIFIGRRINDNNNCKKNFDLFNRSNQNKSDSTLVVESRTCRTTSFYWIPVRFSTFFSLNIEQNFLELF